MQVFPLSTEMLPSNRIMKDKQCHALQVLQVCIYQQKRQFSMFCMLVTENSFSSCNTDLLKRTQPTMWISLRDFKVEI